MEEILVAAYIAFFCYLIRKIRFFRDLGIRTGWLQTAFIAKVAAGCLLGILYTVYYTDPTTSDTLKFFKDSEILFNTLYTEPLHFVKMLTGIGGNDPELRPYYEEMQAWLNKDVLFNDNKTIIRLNAFFRFFSLGYYNVHVVLLNFISFTGLICLYKVFSRVLKEDHPVLFLFLFFYPSLLFWGSGLLKDGLLLFALGLMLLSFHSILAGERNRMMYVYFSVALFLLLFTKFYIIMTVLPGVIAWTAARKNNGWKAAAVFTTVYCAFIVAGFNLWRLLPAYNLADIIYWKQHNFFVLAEMTHARSVIDIPELDYGAMSIVINSPMAFFNALTRPGIFDDLSNPMIAPAAIENTLLLLYTAWLFIARRKKQAGPVQPLHLFSIAVVLLLLTLIGLITPILGAMVRYKIAIYPFLFFLIFTFTENRKTRLRTICRNGNLND